MEEEFRIFFVKPNEQEECSKELVEAYEILCKAGCDFKPEWITPHDCLQADGRGKQSYIFDPFEGEAFNHIRRCGYRIYGPQCILSNLLHGMDLPRTKRQPLHNLAMKDVKISCTSLDAKIREEISELVLLMAGKVDRNLTADVTHLIAGEVGSHKYMVAIENGKSVMVKEWVIKVWELSQTRHIVATDEMFHKYTCPPFLGISLVVSGFKARDRNQLRDLIIQGGGRYSGELVRNECTHLIIKNPEGAKYEAAKKWHIKIVTDRWLFDCMDKKKYLDTKPYEFSEKIQTSTPERQTSLGPSISDISAITITGLNSSGQQVDETTDMTSVRMSGNFLAVNHNNTLMETRKIDATICEADLTTTSGVFLHDCQIYLSGVKPVVEEKLKKIITAGCGLRVKEINDRVTHVVVGETVASDVISLNLLTVSPHIVTVDWLLECFLHRSHVSEEDFLSSNLVQDKSAKSRCDLISAQAAYRLPSVDRDGMGKRDRSRKSDTNQTELDFRVDAPSDVQMAEMLSQYMNPQDEGTSNTRLADKGNVEEGEKSPTRNKHKRISEENVELLTQDPDGIGDTTAVPAAGIFHKMTFVILGFDEGEAEQLALLAEDKGGCVLPMGETQQTPDIAIVPLMGFPVDFTVKEILTNAWLQMCVESDELLPVDDWLSRPIEPPKLQPLVGCCLCVSGYLGVERECIIHLAKVLGATCQDHFARKTRKNLQANTHLVVNQPSGSKFEAAKKWNIPAVGKEWISACLKSGELVPEENYLIELFEEENFASSLNDPNAVSHSTPSHPLLSKMNEVPLISEGKKDQVVENVLVHKNNVADVNLKPTEISTPVQTPVASSERKVTSVSLHSMSAKSEAPKPSFFSTFNLKGVLDTPDSVGNLNKSTPLGETFRKLISKAAQNLREETWSSTKSAEDLPSRSSQTDHQVAALSGVVIAVAKKLGHKQEEYNQIVVELGGDYSWHNGPHVTHFVFQGKTNDLNKEFRKAREERKIIVSPYWLFACKKQNSRVDEGLFPHNYNPNLSLAMTPSSKGTGSRSNTRSNNKLNFELPVCPDSQTAGKSKSVSNNLPAAAVENNGISVKTPNVFEQKKMLGNIDETPSCAKPDESVSTTNNSAGTDVSNEDVGSSHRNDEIKLSRTLLQLATDTPRYQKSARRKVGKAAKMNDQNDSKDAQEALLKTKADEPRKEKCITEMSQSERVTWEDPTECLLMKKLAPHLGQDTKRPDENHQTSKNTSVPGVTDLHQPNRDLGGSTPDVTPTAESGAPACPPTASPSIARLEPSSNFLLNGKGDHCGLSADNKKMPIFLLSGFQNQEKIEYATIIERLGGTVIEKQFFDPVCTHLVINTPTRNEKYLSCVASGHWILHPSYLEISQKEGQFVEEDTFEWGSSPIMPLIQNMPPLAVKLAAAAHYWRRKIAVMKQTNPDYKGAFDGWKVFICLDKSKQDNIRRLLEAGGAEVTTMRPPFPDILQGTHAFVDLSKFSVPKKDLEQLTRAELHCLKAEYIPAFLTDEPPPDPLKFCLPEIIALKESLHSALLAEGNSQSAGSGKKRKKSNLEHSYRSKVPKC